MEHAVAIGFVLVAMLVASAFVLLVVAPGMLFELLAWIVRNLSAAWRGEEHEPFGLRVAGFALVLAGGLIAAYGVALASSLWNPSAGDVTFVVLVIGLGLSVSVWGVALLQKEPDHAENAEELPSEDPLDSGGA